MNETDLKAKTLLEGKIEVFYDGKYPNACSGTLRITVNDVEIYCKRNVCYSTGRVTFDDRWSEHVSSGKLCWSEDENFSKKIREAVADKLEEVGVCCGGCV